jgi:hypothetical protein
VLPGPSYVKMWIIGYLLHKAVVRMKSISMWKVLGTQKGA